MRTVLVVVRKVLGQDLLKMTPTEDQESVEALSAGRPHEALGKGVRSRRSDSALMILMLSLRNTSSKLAVNFASRSRMRNFTSRERSISSELRLRACWVTHSPTGLAVTPER